MYITNKYIIHVQLLLYTYVIEIYPTNTYYFYYYYYKWKTVVLFILKKKKTLLSFDIVLESTSNLYLFIYKSNYQFDLYWKFKCT